MQVLLLIIMLISGSVAIITGHTGQANEVHYTASTPAGPAVRNFLGISQADSVDFIRWNLVIIDNNQFGLKCKYGISKPNTNGFIDEKEVALNGTTVVNNERLTLTYGSKSLVMLVLNANIIHLLEKNGSMMVGNGGWSYTLNAVDKISTREVNLRPFKSHFEDSVVFIGRTPCRGIEELMIGKTRPECYKKKWKITMYKDGPGASAGTYRIGSAESRNGKWKLKTDKANNIIYSLDLNNGNTFDLLQTDENIIYIMDPKGGLMVGDHDFSYSLNRK
ncbi:hypothetical protein ACX0G7_11050 [Flavitalea antarctica]